MVLHTQGFLFLLFPLAPLGWKLLNSVSHVAYLGFLWKCLSGGWGPKGNCLSCFWVTPLPTPLLTSTHYIQVNSLPALGHGCGQPAQGSMVLALSRVLLTETVRHNPGLGAAARTTHLGPTAPPSLWNPWRFIRKVRTWPGSP